MGLEKESEMSEDDKRLQEELLTLADVLVSPNEKSWSTALAQLRNLMRTSTTSMTSVPKPLKYLRNSYGVLKTAFTKLKTPELKQDFSDLLSVLAMAGATPGSRECLKYCLQGTMNNPGEWGHEYVRQLEAEIAEEWAVMPVKEENRIREQLMPLVQNVIKFDMKHNAEIQACDLCLEIDQLGLINDHLDPENYNRVCLYLVNCAAYSEEAERTQVLETAATSYIKFGEYAQALLVALQLGDDELVSNCLENCSDSTTRKQLAFILTRQQDRPLKREYSAEDAKDIEVILSNVHVNGHFQTLARELDILEPKLPEDIYKSWLETGGPRHLNHDSARANLASSFVSGFVHAGFGVDKLMANTEECWVYKNKDHGMLSATASLGLIHIWDVDGGLVPIDKYLYTTDDLIKSGALLAIGIVNCGVRNECDPALALLTDYVENKSQTLRVGATLGLGLAYAGSRRQDVSELLTGALSDKESNMEVVSLAAIALGLINVGSNNSEISLPILQKLLDLTPLELASTHSRFLPLALGMIYMGRRDMIEAVSAALEVLQDPYKLSAQTMLQVCAYAGTGDVLIVQELLRICSEPVIGETGNPTSSVFMTPSSSTVSANGIMENPNAKITSSNFSKNEEFQKEIGYPQAVASLGVGIVGLGEGKENARIFSQVGRYGPAPARRAVPLSLALSSLSNPDPVVVDILNKYSHDSDVDVAHNAIFGLGLVGAGTNNARLATMLRQLAAYHAKNPLHLFLIRLAQGLVHLGKGTLTLCPLHYGARVLNKSALAGLLVVLVSFLDCRNLILGKSHYLIYCLVTAMQPRWLVTLDENLKAIPVSVRVGQAVDIVGKAGSPKTIAGGHVHTTPVLLAAGERAELATDEHEPLAELLEGFVILREKPSD